MQKYNRKRTTVKNTVLAAMLAAVFAVSAYIHVPFAVPFTLQTFALALCVVLAGVGNTFKMLAVYTAIGCVGLPVFSSFRGGISVLLEPTGGFIIGFFVMTAVFALLKRIMPEFGYKDEICLVLSLAALYACGSLWYNYVYLSGTWHSLASSFAVCAAPYVIPDIAKVLAGSFAAKRLKKYINM